MELREQFEKEEGITLTDENAGVYWKAYAKWLKAYFELILARDELVKSSRPITKPLN